MDGSITERQDPEGRIRRKGEMKLPHRKYIYITQAIVFLILCGYRCKTNFTTIQVGDLSTANITSKRCLSY
jgi:hypothetical protein